ncbi:hypothetical protein MAE02_68330 [Microvirga aerophila]|uniref:Uncharacterized protein n=1 Tax=Microvirga aerophila TaxID=670291 RepID=A0A512C506_9HYPH|nr:hypothetical protein MAE02_68330 [Microvirga aerophila]
MAPQAVKKHRHRLRADNALDILYNVNLQHRDGVRTSLVRRAIQRIKLTQAKARMGTPCAVMAVVDVRNC